MAPIGSTVAHAGVMATSPATAPDAPPSAVGLPSRIHSTKIQPSSAAPVATWVLMNANADWWLAASAEPALNPNQPNHSSAAPVSTIGTLCGLNFSFRQPMRLPSTSARASAAAPAFTCTAVPPAKSNALSRSEIQPPLPLSKKNTQWATGKYTIVVHAATKMTQGPNRARSAIAPEIRAGVMIANMSWNAANAKIGVPWPAVVVEAPNAPRSP